MSYDLMFFKDPFVVFKDMQTIAQEVAVYIS